MRAPRTRRSATASPCAWSYREFRDEAVRVAHFPLRRLGRSDDRHPPRVAMLLENRPELLALYAGCAYSGMTLFGVNTGLRGETLRGVLDQSRARAAHARASGEPARASHPRRRVARRAGLPRMPRARGREGGHLARHTRRRSPPRGQPDRDLHLRHDRPAEGHQQLSPEGAADRKGGVASPPTRRGRRRLRLHAALPLEFDVSRLPPRVRDGRDSGDVRALQREEFRAGRLPLRRHVLELRRRAGALHPRRHRAPVPRRRGAHPRGGHRGSPQPPALRARQRRLASGHRSLRALARARGHVRALRLDRGGDQHLPQAQRPTRLGRRDHRSRREDPRRARSRVRGRESRPMAGC